MRYVSWQPGQQTVLSALVKAEGSDLWHLMVSVAGSQLLGLLVALAAAR